MRNDPDLNSGRENIVVSVPFRSVPFHASRGYNHGQPRHIFLFFFFFFYINVYSDENLNV